MIRILLLLIPLALLAAGLTWLLTRPPVPKPFVDSYHAALARFPGSDRNIEAGLDRFADVYANLTDERIGERIESLYADPLYFNDTLKTFESRNALADYMTATSDRLATSRVSIDQVIREGNDAFVRWTMQFATDAPTGRAVESESVGITHLRFDPQGRIVVHQDFWDAASGLYRNLPVVGYILHQADRRMMKPD